MDDINILDLLAKAGLKMVLILGGMMMVFLTLPTSRTSMLFFAGVIGSFVGGIMIQLMQDQFNLLLLTTVGFSIGFGIVLLPLLSIISRLNLKLSEDNVLIDELYAWLKELIIGKIKKKFSSK